MSVELLLGNGGLHVIRVKLSGSGRLRHVPRDRNIRDGNVGRQSLGFSTPPPNIFSHVTPYGQAGGQCFEAMSYLHLQDCRIRKKGYQWGGGGLAISPAPLCLSSFSRSAFPSTLEQPAACPNCTAARRELI